MPVHEKDLLRKMSIEIPIFVHCIGLVKRDQHQITRIHSKQTSHQGRSQKLLLRRESPLRWEPWWMVCLLTGRQRNFLSKNVQKCFQESTPTMKVCQILNQIKVSRPIQVLEYRNACIRWRNSNWVLQIFAFCQNRNNVIKEWCC